MHRIDSLDTVAERPSPTVPETLPGYFQNGSPDDGASGTVVDAHWLNTVQEELLGVVEAGGQTPSRTDSGQLLPAIKKLAGDEADVALEPVQAQAAAALLAAGQAQEAADEAQEAADMAQRTAGRAQETAEAAGQLAGQALTEAESARRTSDGALTAADNALYFAAQANGLYSTVDEAIDIDELAFGPKRMYVVNPDSANSPVAIPFYIRVETNSGVSAGSQEGNTSVTQTVWSDPAGGVWTRLGAVTPAADPEDDPTVTWGAWKQTGAGGGGGAVEPSDATPLANGTAAAGDSTEYARGNHVHPKSPATTADSLATARTIQTNLASTSAASFDGSANTTPGVTGVLPIANGGSGTSALYGTCSTAAATAAKIGILSGFRREVGSIVGLKFIYANTAANPTLNVNSTGAANIYYKGAAITAEMIPAGHVALFQFNGTQWELLNPASAGVPLPNTSTGVGRWAVVTVSYSESYTLPSGGSWAYFFLKISVAAYAPTQLRIPAGGVAAGGTTILPADAALFYGGFVWRIA